MIPISLHPIFDRFTVYNDHYAEELSYPGDALGRDCMIAAFVPDSPMFMQLFRNDGTHNEDWFSWNEKVYSPVMGIVKEIYLNEIVNVPGSFHPSRASSITIEAEDGLLVLLAHIQSPLVAVGDTVTEGQHIAFVGNNGYARCPHIHLGAIWKGTPLPIAFDPLKVALMRHTVSEAHWSYGI